MNLVNLASQYYRTTISVFLFIIISGSLVFNNIPKESAPDVNLPYIYVSLGLTGISPEDSEKLLIKPVEDEVSNIEGKKEMTSTSYQNGGNILLEFNAGLRHVPYLDTTRTHATLGIGISLHGISFHYAYEESDVLNSNDNHYFSLDLSL